MKVKQTLILATLILVMVVLAWSCKTNGDKKKQIFSGIILDENDQPVEGVSIEIGERAVTTVDSGKFTIAVNKAERYVLNVSKLGYGFVSKIYTTPTINLRIEMTIATVRENLDPEQEIRMTDTTPSTSEPLSATITPEVSPIRTIPFVYDATGRLVGFGDPSIVAAYKAIAASDPQQQGAEIVIEPDALEEQGANASLFQGEKGKITGSINTVDIYSPDGMPGDYSLNDKENGNGWMETYGAADVSFYRNGKQLQLKKDRYATLSIPVDTISQLRKQEALPKTIPILVYNKQSGYWTRDVDKWTGKQSIGVLDKKRKVYIARISHFSTFNADEEFGFPACLRICNDPAAATIIPSTAKIEITSTAPPHNYTFSTGCTTGCAGGFLASAIARLKQNSPIGIRLFDATGVIQHTYAVIGGTPSTPDIFMESCPGNHYSTCSTEIPFAWNSVENYMNTAAGMGGTMIKPVAAGDIVGGKLRISWIFIPERVGTPANYTTTIPRQYKLEWTSTGTYLAANSINLGASNTNWHNFQDVDLALLNYSGSTSAPFTYRVTVVDLAGDIHGDPLPCSYDVNADVTECH